MLRALADGEPALLDHAREVAELADAVAHALGLDHRAREEIARAAELHDVGKLAIPPEILAKRGPLGAPEHALMRRHTVVGEAMIGCAPALRRVALLVRASHERWDGHGYPDGLRGDAIPLGARIVAVCDAYSAMREDRPYGRGALRGRAAGRAGPVRGHPVRPPRGARVLPRARRRGGRGLTPSLR